MKKKLCPVCSEPLASEDWRQKFCCQDHARIGGLAAQRARYVRNRDAIIARTKARRLSNPEYKKWKAAYDRSYFAANREKKAARQAAYYARNRERINAQNAARAKEHRIAYLAMKQIISTGEQPCSS
jgi:hypothetical protein